MQPEKSNESIEPKKKKSKTVSIDGVDVPKSELVNLNGVWMREEDVPAHPYIAEMHGILNRGVDSKWESLKLDKEISLKLNLSFASIPRDGAPQIKPPTKDNPLYKPFYDENEPDWLSELCGITRMGAYEAVIFKGSTYKDYKAQCSFFNHFKTTAGLIGGRLAVLGYFFLCPPIGRFFWAVSLLTDLGILASAVKVYCAIEGVKSEQRKICSSYQEKSMEYIFKEAYEKKYITLKVEALEPSKNLT